MVLHNPSITLFKAHIREMECHHQCTLLYLVFHRAVYKQHKIRSLVMESKYKFTFKIIYRTDLLFPVLKTKYHTANPNYYQDSSSNNN